MNAWWKNKGERQILRTMLTKYAVDLDVCDLSDYDIPDSEHGFHTLGLARHQ